MPINNVTVIGAGTMGNGIAHVFAQYGFTVVLNDIREEFIERGMRTIAGNLDRQVKKGTITESQKKETLGRVRTTTVLEDAVKNADIVIEAATEDEAVKKKLFSSMDKIAPPHAVLATNTSSIAITEIAASTARPQKVIGMHFMNPVPVMKLVEVIRGLATDEETLRTVIDLARKLDKVPVEANDFPGFISNRILLPMINEAIFTLQENVGTPEAIDTVMKLGMNHPMGPLALADLIGLDVVLFVMEVLQHDLGEDKYRPAPLLRKMVDAGYLGKKSGQGFYKY